MKKLVKRSAAAGMLASRGVKYSSMYLDSEHPYPCEHKHADCANYKWGPCSAEMVELIKVEEAGNIT